MKISNTYRSYVHYTLELATALRTVKSAYEADVLTTQDSSQWPSHTPDTA